MINLNVLTSVQLSSLGGGSANFKSSILVPDNFSTLSLGLRQNIAVSNIVQQLTSVFNYGDIQEFTPNFPTPFTDMNGTFGPIAIYNVI